MLTLERGIVVEFLTKGAEGERVGIQSGDILLHWTRDGKGGEIESPFDLNYIKVEEAPRGRIELTGLRGSEKRKWLLNEDVWGIWARPNFQGELLSAYLEELRLAESGKLEEAVDRWRALAPLAQRLNIPWLNPWLLSHAAQVSTRHRQWDGYDSAYQESLQAANNVSPLVKAEIIRQWAGGFWLRGDWVNAEKHFEESLEEWQKLGLRTMAAAGAWIAIGKAAIEQGNLVKAGSCLREALSISEELAPSSLQTGSDLSDLGDLSNRQGNLSKAEDYYRRALEIEQKMPSSPKFTATLFSMGILSHRRGHLAKAEEYYRKALSAAEVRDTNNNELLPDILSYLAECVLDRGKPELAEEYEQRSLALRQKQRPGTIYEASSFRNLGKIARVRGDLVKAEEYYNRALSIGEKISPTSLSVTRLLVGLGYVARDRGDPKKAEDYYRRALARMETVEPDSLDHADTLADLAGALRDQKQLISAGNVYRHAISELENITIHLSEIDEDRARYRALNDRYYREYVDVLVAQGQPELAFEALEGSRARTLYGVLARANVNIHEGIDSHLLQRERDLQHLRSVKAADRLRLLTEKHAEAQMAATDLEIADLFDQYQQVEAEIRSKSPAYAALTQPRSLNTADIQQLLDSDTLLLEYSLGDQRSHVWVVNQNSLNVFELPRRSEIEPVARHVYELLISLKRGVKVTGDGAAQENARLTDSRKTYPREAAKLSQMVLGPVAGLLKGKRLVIVSDGALQYVPFAALPVPENADPQQSRFTGGDGAFSRQATSSIARRRELYPLILEHEVVSLPSASVMVELRRQAVGRQRPPRTVAILADPIFSALDERVKSGLTRQSRRVPSVPASPLAATLEPSLEADHLTRSIADFVLPGRERGYLNRLPYTRREADAIMAVTPAGMGMEALDFRANRATVTSTDLREYRIVHFATHGLLNNEQPELSGLVLSLVDDQGRPQNGFLELADIYNLKLPVELVVLSACDTALGQEMNGEGLIGLTRGFMYAGASRVVASLWKVNDRATSELMALFYKSMEQDKLRPAAALRFAQIQMLRQHRWKSPYYWASFQIQGEWK